jgi:thiamine-phosphate pyrophosphorylase
LNRWAKHLNEHEYPEAAVKRSCELYLRVAAGRSGGWPDLEPVVRIARPSVLLITGIGPGVDAASLRPFVAAARRLDLAVMIENDSHLAKALDADGVHLRAGSEALAEVRRLLGEEKSIGVSCVLSRHEAMLMAEDGADYIAFGEFGLPGDADAAEVADMIEWWAEIFEVPCVAWAREDYSEDELRGIVEAGPDYLSVALGAGDAAEAVRRYAVIAELVGARAGLTLSA